VASINQLIRVSAFAMILLLATLTLLELGTTLAFFWFEQWPTRASIQSSLDDARVPKTSDEEPIDRPRTNVLHPYIGYVRNAQRIPRHFKRRFPDASINEAGFFGPSPLAAKDDDVARVVITGGSVAEELFVFGGELLARNLEASGAFEGRSVEVVSLAMAGFKQPQQLIAVSYLLLLGAQFDAVVNVDGFNEVVLPFTEIVPLDVAPSYPFRWNALAIDTGDTGTAHAVVRIGESMAELETWRELFSSFPLRHSAFALAIWHAVKTRLDGEIIGLEVELREQLGASLQNRPGMRGPPAQFESDDAIFDDSVEIWRRASFQLWQLCRSHGVAYLHVLQPNQYVAGSKPFTPSERKVALRASHNPTRIAAEAGYTRMIDVGASLVEAGLPFPDISERVDKPIYRDHCCHYHRLGYTMIASRIAEELGLTSDVEADGQRSGSAHQEGAVALDVVDAKR